jgi:hypothetical protein
MQLNQSQIKNKVQLIKTLNDISNLVTEENKEFLISGKVESLNFVINTKDENWEVEIKVRDAIKSKSNEE